ncbi:MAG: conserved phage C-terminal domain-containing protein [Clostridium perfringens]|nr:conserved phage C-terminal domain-containing protein [Clostridium perfringens]
MATFRVVKNKKYTVVDNYFIDDPNLSLKAKGLLLMFLKRPDDWNIYLSELEKCCKDKKDSINTAVKELEKFGYVNRNLKRDEKGKLIGGYDFLIRETPSTESGFPVIGEIPNRENPPLINTDININTNIYSQVIDYLNSKAGKSFKYTTKKTQDLIKARLADGFKKEEFFRVIDNKVKEWKGTEYEKYLRPETLFGNKFEGYLNQGVNKKSYEERKENNSKDSFDY